jgi:hypothetical protein
MHKYHDMPKRYMQHTSLALQHPPNSTTNLDDNRKAFDSLKGYPSQLSKGATS